MPTADRWPPSLERELLRRGVGARAAASRRCADCRRTPLVGERLYVYEGGRLACELCKPLRKEEPVRWELVHGTEHGHAVRVRVGADTLSPPWTPSPSASPSPAPARRSSRTSPTWPTTRSSPTTS